jgi:SAM-dependent methyltransferase
MSFMRSVLVRSDVIHFGRMLVRVLLIVYLPLCTVLAVLHYPRDTDSSYSSQSAAASSGFYDAAYSSRKNRGLDYEAFARAAAQQSHITEVVQKFVREYRLSDKHVLEVGSGRGYLQDLVQDYTGLDLSTSVAGHYHKPFVAASATAMPFKANSFDAIWTVWVLEHIPEPERALTEMLRVLKPGATLFLFPAWDCTPWAADGLDVRPYSDFNWRGKVVKGGLVFYPFYQFAFRFTTRAARWLQYTGGSSSLRYRRLRPNYDVYWQGDSDAAVSLDRFETYLWFRAHGDQCLNCGSTGQEFRKIDGPLIIRIIKPQAQKERSAD